VARRHRRQAIAALGLLALGLGGGLARTPHQPWPAEAAPPGPTPATTAAALITATPVPASASSGVVGSASAVYYDDGREVFVAQADGSGRFALGILPPDNEFIPHAAGGRLLYSDGAYWLATSQGQRFSVAAPPLIGNEKVFAAWPSPDGTRIAWQLYAPATYGTRLSNLGASRIVVTDSGGGGARTVLQQASGSIHGDVPELVGWRAEGQPVAGGPPGTLLLATRLAAEADGTRLRGLLELDPSISDLVNDYLPPLGDADLPVGQTLSVSQDGRMVTYAPAQALLPSGEGPLPTALSVLDLRTGATRLVDRAAAYPGGTDARHPWTRYPYFSARAGAPISPDDAHVLYTVVTVTYPDGALAPHLDEVARMASLASGQATTLAQGARALGWLSAGTALVRRQDGLYAVDITTKAARRIVEGHNLRFLGVRG